MNIQIICDQLDCIYNEGSKVHHDHPNDVCKHVHPAIQRYLPLKGEMTICNSKNTVRTGALLPVNPKTI